MPRLKTLVAIDLGVDHDTVQSSLPFGGDVEIVGVVEGVDEAWRTLQATPCDLLLVATAGHSDRALFLVESAVKQDERRPVVVMCDTTENGFVRRAFEAGADDLLALGEPPAAVLFALRKAVARRAGAASASDATAAPLICVLGPKGGTGKTLTACNLAVSFALAGRQTVLVDLDLQFGDVGLALGLAPERTIYDLARAGGSIDYDKVADYLVEHESGLRVLLAPTRPDQAAMIGADLLRDVYAALRANVDMVVVDTSPGFSSEVIASIDNSTHVCMVGMLDSLSLKNTKLGLETLELMDYASDRVRIVLNRADSRVGITREDAERVIGREPDALVPSDREVPRATNEGVPIVMASPRSAVAHAFEQLSRLYLVDHDASRNGHAAAPTRVRGLLKRRG